MEQLKVETITPKIARTLLERNTSNRKVTQNHVAFLAKQMDDDRWVLNGESIKVSKTGALLDGQHRLMAVIKSGKNIRSVIARGIEDNTFTTIDIGKNRSAGDVLSVAGFLRPGPTAAVAKLILTYKDGYNFKIYTKTGSNSGGGASGIRSGRTKITNAEVLEFCEQTDLLPYIVRGESAYQKCRLLAPAEFGFFYYIFSEIDADDAEIFMNKFASGAGLEANEPVLVLRNRLIQFAANSSVTASGRARFSFVVKAWNHFRLDTKVKTLNYHPGSELPKPI
jgi:hypothetical protein